MIMKNHETPKDVKELYDETKGRKTIVVRDSDPDGDHIALMLLASLHKFGIRPYKPDSK